MGDGGGAQVGAGDLVAKVEQDLGDAAHADAADADEMDALDFGEHGSYHAQTSSAVRAANPSDWVHPCWTSFGQGGAFVFRHRGTPAKQTNTELRSFK